MLPRHFFEAFAANRVEEARCRVFKNHHPDWESDIEALYTRQFTNSGVDPVRLANPTC